MEENWMYGGRPPSVLADLGPLPEVTESNSETTWKAFLEAQAFQNGGFAPTLPATVAAPPPQVPASGVQAAMLVARQHNRICPREPEWHALRALLQELTGAEPPAPLTGAQGRATPPLVKRIRIRDQVEWAAGHGQLPAVLAFFSSLPEERWLHMGD